MRRATPLIPLLLLVTAAVHSFGQTPTAGDKAAEFAEEIKRTPCDSTKRKEAVIALFEKMGAPESAIKTQEFDQGENILVTKQGKSAETIFIGAHYDKVDDGCGAIDNWTGILILANIYHALVNVPTEKTYIFAAFDSEEKGLLGSKYMAKKAKAETDRRVCSMVNFDSFGFTAPQAPGNMANSKMVRAAKDLAKDLDFVLYSDSIDNGDSDSSAFIDVGIPAITFDGLNAAGAKYLHNTNDRVEGIDAGSLVSGYSFGLMFIAKLDTLPCDAFLKKSKK